MTMEKDSKIDDLPPPYEDVCGEPTEDCLEPAVLVLKGQTVHAESESGFAPPTRLYEMNRMVTSIPQEGSSVIFERVVDVPFLPEKPGYDIPPRRKHLYYLVHPLHAQYRSDLPSQYYITSAQTDSLGNIRLETSKSMFQKTEFKALLSAKRCMDHKPLFDKDSEQVLFLIKPKWTGGRYKIMDCDGKEVAYEDGDGDERKLVVTASMERVVRDALVAVWVLKAWHDTMESKEAKREALERMTPVPVNYDGRLGMSTGALGALAAGGAGGGGL